MIRVYSSVSIDGPQSCRRIENPLYYWVLSDYNDIGEKPPSLTPSLFGSLNTL